MILLASTSDLLRVTTSAAGDIDVHCSWVDLASGASTPGRTNTNITSATTTTITASPASSTYRTVKTVQIRNAHATTAQDLTIVHTDGTTAVELCKVTLSAGWTLHYDEHAGWSVKDTTGAIVLIDTASAIAAGTAINVVTVSSDVTANTAANTMADFTGLSFSVTAGETYWFRFFIQYTSTATGTGSRWSISGPSSPTALRYRSEYSLTTTSRTINEGLSTYDAPASSNATSAATAGNIAVIEGFIKPSANGTVIARFASETASGTGTITAKAGSILHWQRTL